MTFSSKPTSRRWFFFTCGGSNVPSRSRGTWISTGPADETRAHETRTDETGEMGRRRVEIGRSWRAVLRSLRLFRTVVAQVVWWEVGLGFARNRASRTRTVCACAHDAVAAVPHAAPQ